MRHEFETTGPVAVAAKMRSSDLVLLADESAPTLLVDVEPRGDNGAELAAATRVEFAHDRLEIVVPKVSNRLFGRRASVLVTVTFPPGSTADVESGSGDTRAQGSLARADVRAGSGDVSLERVEDLRLTLGSGDASIGETGSAVVTSGSGDLRIGRSTGVSELRTGSGDVLVEDAASLSVTTGSGDAIIGAVAGDVRLASGSGDLLIRRAVHGEINGKVASGDVVVGVAQGTAALLDCSSISGRVSSDLEAGGEPGEGENGLVLRLRTVSGDVRVQRA